MDPAVPGTPAHTTAEAPNPQPHPLRTAGTWVLAALPGPLFHVLAWVWAGVRPLFTYLVPLWWVLVSGVLITVLVLTLVGVYTATPGAVVLVLAGLGYCLWRAAGTVRPVVARICTRKTPEQS